MVNRNLRMQYMARLIGDFSRINILTIVVLLFSTVARAEQADFVVLCYHDVKDEILKDVDNDQYAVSTDTLVAHFNWLKAHGYSVISFDDVLAAQRGEKKLAKRSVLLTFDDGYRSFYTRIYPLLKLYNYPAVFALVGSWLEVEAGGVIDYGDELVPREKFLSWDEIKEMHTSGLIEFASHSYDLHKGIIANPQANLIPAAITHTYHNEKNLYETRAEYLVRVSNDLQHNSKLIERQLGVKPRIMVWPYGAYNHHTLQLAKESGMEFNLTLDSRRPKTENLQTIGRVLISGNPGVDIVKEELTKSEKSPDQRIVHVDLDYIYDSDESQQEKNLDQLVERIKSMRASTVYLQAFADPDADGIASELYFPNRHLPMRADLFSRVAWQLKTRADTNIYAWMPMLAFDLNDKKKQQELMVQTDGQIDNKPNVYRRLSPFNNQARKIIRDIYEDLAKHSVFNGLLFHDDALLSDFEDTSSAAIVVYTKQWGLPADINLIKKDEELFNKWSQLKTQWLIDFSLELAIVVGQHQKNLITARNLYAEVILDPDSEAWYAQNFSMFIQNYDYTAVMAMPYLENAEDPEIWLSKLVEHVKQIPGALNKTVFELQSRDWRFETEIPTHTLLEHIELLANAGAHHIGYYPDDFVNDHPRLDEIISGISTNDYPYDQ